MASGGREDRQHERWRAQFHKGLLELCILQCLAIDARYGYEIARLLAGEVGLSIGEGTVYPLLSRLRNERLVESSFVESRSGPVRKYYRLTPLGRRRLKAMDAAWDRAQRGIQHLRGRTG